MHTTTSTSLIVGGTSGIGLATARKLAADGGHVHVAARGQERLDELAVSDPALHGHRVDGADHRAVGALAASIAPIDHLIVTLSGSEGIGPFAQLDLAMLRRAFDAKFWAHITTVQAALPSLAPDASISLVGAITAHTGMAGTAGVAAINAAVEALVKPLAVELAPMRVNAVSPGFVDTPWWDGMPEEERRAYFEATAQVLPARQIATAEQVAEAVALVARNPNLTGTTIETDAGLRLVSVG
jgi:NAD(P)-dependent dehydrogenase (short-subunit alcohol dehydrogenase family)